MLVFLKDESDWLSIFNATFSKYNLLSNNLRLRYKLFDDKKMYF